MKVPRAPRSSQSSLIMVFVDGLGIGPRADTNPLSRFAPRVLNIFQDEPLRCRDGGLVLPTDVLLGTPGVPQSATNQTTLFTGLNAGRALGRHLSGFPNNKLKEIIVENSLMKRLLARGIPVTFSNAYRPSFFSSRPRWISVTTVMCESAGVRLRTLGDLQRERALYMDYSNHLLREQGFEVPPRSPGRAARVLIELAQEYPFCLYEYFLTDVAGHRGTLQEATEILMGLDAFLASLVEGLEPGQSLLVTSDHGNIEAMGQRGHTTNPVATFLWGDVRERVRGRSDLLLTEISGLIERHLSGSRQ